MQITADVSKILKTVQPDLILFYMFFQYLAFIFPNFE